MSDLLMKVSTGQVQNAHYWAAEGQTVENSDLVPVLRDRSGCWVHAATGNRLVEHRAEALWVRYVLAKAVKHWTDNNQRIEPEPEPHWVRQARDILEE